MIITPEVLCRLTQGDMNLIIWFMEARMTLKMLEQDAENTMIPGYYEWAIPRARKRVESFRRLITQKEWWEPEK